MESTSIQKIAEFGGLLDREPDRFGAKTTIEIYDHYGRQQDYEKVKAGEYSRVDFLEGKEEDIRELTADMAGFGCNQSQRVIIEYDKGYGYFLAKRIPVEYGEPGSDQQDKRDTACQKGINRTIHGTGIQMDSENDDISLDCRLSFYCAKSRDRVSMAVKEFFASIAEILEEDRKLGLQEGDDTTDAMERFTHMMEEYSESLSGVKY